MASLFKRFISVSHSLLGESIDPILDPDALINDKLSIPYGIDSKTGREWESWQEWYSQHPEKLP